MTHSQSPSENLGASAWRTDNRRKKIWVPHPCFVRVRVLTFPHPNLLCNARRASTSTFETQLPDSSKIRPAVLNPSLSTVELLFTNSYHSSVFVVSILPARTSFLPRAPKGSPQQSELSRPHAHHSHPLHLCEPQRPLRLCVILSPLPSFSQLSACSCRLPNFFPCVSYAKTQGTPVPNLKGATP